MCGLQKRWQTEEFGDTFGSGHLWRGRVGVFPKGLLFTKQLLSWQTEEDSGQFGPCKWWCVLNSVTPQTTKPLVQGALQMGSVRVTPLLVASVGSVEHGLRATPKSKFLVLKMQE